MKAARKFNLIWRHSSSRLLDLILLPILLASPHVTHGQSDSYSITTWGSRNGLPEMSVQALTIEPTRGLFVGTAGGLLTLPSESVSHKWL
jgi:hypothetical protein